ncbi:DUF4328 domain-containing protein [Streptomyces beihaiensis]|uniref:DUF4328 domain-containing protein n=1 Tax=Streptomyces beihaiensis TaxID=2984495 RepID=A0ABT3TTB3_9ACTN|nr:DUF4328 domain-containing protein [Streptomyces beihaiensis]MCX3060279.1 DUF4328 domain-containing protein [Streptomyces beihaiensis]
MTPATRKAPWFLARCAQAATAAAAVLDAFRTVALRDYYLHRTAAALHKSAMISMVFVYAMTLTLVLLLVWLDRCRSNARELSPQAALPSRGWTAGSWFIPVVNFFAGRKSVLAIGRASSTSWEGRRGTTLVNLWWGAWMGHVAVLAVVMRMAPGSMVVLVVAEALMIAAGVLLVLVIERITALQRDAFGASAPAVVGAQRS